MGDTENRLLLTSDDVRLLRHSYLMTQFPSLQKVLQEKDKISYKDIPILDDELKNILLHDLGNFKDRIIDEWVALREGAHLKPYENEEFTTCQVCNNPKCKCLYCIVNKINGNEIYVGSTCIYKYIDIGLYGEDKKSYLQKADSYLQKIRHTAEFNRVFPGAIKKVKSWYEDYLNLPLKLPYEIESQFLRCYNKAQKIIERVQAESVNRAAIARFTEVLKEYVDVEEIINDYVEKNKGNRFALTSKAFAWLNRKTEKKQYNKLFETCVITEKEYALIWEKDFVLRFIPDYKKVLINIGITDINCNFESYFLVFVYQKGYNRILLTCSMEDFLKKYWPVVYYDLDSVDHDEFLKLCKVNKDEKTMDYFRQELNGILRDTPLEIDAVYNEYDRLYLKDIQRDKFKEMPLSNFINNYKMFVLKDDIDQETKKGFSLYMKDALKGGVWMDSEDYESIIDKLESNVRVTKEFI